MTEWTEAERLAMTEYGRRIYANAEGHMLRVSTAMAMVDAIVSYQAKREAERAKEAALAGGLTEEQYVQARQMLVTNWERTIPPIAESILNQAFGPPLQPGDNVPERQRTPGAMMEALSDALTHLGCAQSAVREALNMPMAGWEPTEEQLQKGAKLLAVTSAAVQNAIRAMQEE